MNEAELHALSQVLDYLESEKDDFENTPASKRSNHIYNHVKTLDEYWRRQRSEKKKSKKKTRGGK